MEASRHWFTHVFRTGHFFTAEQRLKQFLAVACANFAHLMVRLAHQLQQRLRQHTYRGRRCFLHKDVAIVAMLKSVQHQLDSVV